MLAAKEPCWNPEDGSRRDSFCQRNGHLTGKKTEDEAGTMTVTLTPGALWKNTGTSTVATVHAENGIIRPDGGAVLTIGTYDGKNGALDLKDGKGGGR